MEQEGAPAAEKEPAGQKVQVEEPCDATVPAAQVAQLAAPDTFEAVPGRQVEHVGAPAAEKNPGPHAVQFAALVAPCGPAAKPAGQAEHVTAPVEFMYVPAGQVVQLEAPAAGA